MPAVLPKARSRCASVKGGQAKAAMGTSGRFGKRPEPSATGSPSQRTKSPMAKHVR